MAANDTAALVVALSAQVSRFERDMKSAVDVADRRTKEIENTFTRLNSTITNKLSSVTAGLTGNIGFAGQLLTSLGPAGVVAAAGAGAAAGAIYFLANATAEFAEKSKALKEAAETAGLTIGQMKALGAAGKQAGLDSEETTAFFTKYLANLAQLREGSGPLFDALLKIDVGLLRQLATTKDSAQAIDILIKAYAKLGDQTSKLQLARAAGGRAGLSGSRLLESLGANGGMDEINRKAAQVDEAQYERAAKLSREIDAIQKKTANIWGGMFSDRFLQSSKAMAEDFQKIALAVERISQGKNPFTTDEEDHQNEKAGAEKALAAARLQLGSFEKDLETAKAFAASIGPNADKDTTGFNAAKAGVERYRAEIERLSASLEKLKSEKIGSERGGSGAPSAPLLSDVATKPEAPAAEKIPSVELELLRQKITLLGDGVRQGELYRVKTLEIAAAVEKNKDLTSVAGRAQAAFNVVMRAAAVATRERLAVANEQQIIDSRLEQLQLDRTKYGLTENEVQRATVVILREAKAAAEQLEVRRAYLPGLKALEQDSRSVAKGLDGVLSTGLNTFTDDLTAFVTGTKTAKDAFADMTKSILSDIVKLTIRQALVAPLAGGLGGLFGTGGFKIPGFASGTDSAPGGPAIVGENGPELVNLPKGSQVIPNHVAAKGGSGSPNVTIVQHIDATGADAAAITRLHQGLVEVNASIEKRVGNMLAQQRRYN